LGASQRSTLLSMRFPIAMIACQSRRLFTLSMTSWKRRTFMSQSKCGWLP